MAYINKFFVNSYDYLFFLILFLIGIYFYKDFGFNIENLTKNVLKKKFISKLESIIDDNNFDLMWYDFGTRDYIWARDTIHSANEAISNINLL